MIRKALILLVVLFTYITAESQNKEAISVKSLVVENIDSGTKKINDVHITEAIILNSNTESFVPEERKAITSKATDNSKVKISKTRVSSTVILMKVEQFSENKNSQKREAIGNKTNKRHVIVTPLTAKKIEN
jgi:hypothetical protein